MIPTNTNNINPCDPISSNCVVWQGPDLPCVDICEGDTISDVVAALCTQISLLQVTINNGVEFDITHIDQSCLIGTQAGNIEELIQLMIDNICNHYHSNSGSGSTFTCEMVMKCATSVPSCFLTITSFTQNGNLDDWITAASTLLCDLNNHQITQSATTSAVSQRVSNLEQQPQGDPTTKLYSSGVVAKNVLTPINIIVQALDTQFMQLRGTTGVPSNISIGVNAQPDLKTPLSTTGFPLTMKDSPVTAGDALYNIWNTISDIRSAVTHIQDNCCNTVQLQRMGSITTFYAMSIVDCDAALAAAASAANCSDIWNSTGVQFDATVRAYSSPYSPSSNTELTHLAWYALCATGPMSQYSNQSPHWGTIKVTCAE